MQRPSTVSALLITTGGAVLLTQQALGEVWALPAHITYAAFIALLMVSVFITPRVPPQQLPIVLTLLWVLLAGVLVAGAYVPSGWNLWNRALLVGMVVVLTVHGVGQHRAQGGLTHARALTVAVTVALTVFFTYALDRGVGAATGGQQPGGVVFPRNSFVSYQTPEFAFSAHINRYGFRGENINLDVPVGCRVMLLGDSFTYGWGVDYAQTWGALLEGHMREAGIDAQVLNLGAPGANVPDYATIAETAAPLLQPDVIIVGVLQGDDMRQMSREAAPFPRPLTFGDDTPPTPLAEYVSFHYPFIAKRTVLAHIPADAVQRNWQATAARFAEQYQQREEWLTRYRSIELTVRGHFLNGDISPHFVHFAVVMPDYWMWALQDPATLTPYIAQMGAEFERLVAAAPDAHIVVVSVPHGAYTQPQAHADLAEMGFFMPPELLASPLVDDAIEQAANTAGLPFLAVTQAFRDHETLAFYPLDGHFNAEGNRLFAEALAPSATGWCGDQ